MTIRVLTPTPEQDECIGLFLTGDPLIIEAGAGTGKTSVLEMIARATERIGLYMAFNKSIVRDAEQRFPMTVKCKTTHGLAMRAVGGRFADAGRLPTKRMHGHQMGKHLGIDPVACVGFDGKDKRLAPGYLAGLVLKGIAAWCQSADVGDPDPAYIPFVRSIDKVGSTHNNDQLREFLRPTMVAAWADLNHPEGALPFTHDHYLKMFQLTDPKLPCDYLVVDEGQDLAPVQVALALGQVKFGTQLVIVGDSQQQIYEWRGAVNALGMVEGHRAFLTQSWRFGQRIAELANVFLSELGSPLQLKGNPAMNSTIGVCTPRAILCRSNVGAVNSVLRLQKAGRHPHLVGGGEDVVRFAKGVADLQDRGKTSHPDLACFDSWADVLAYVDEDPQGDELALMVRMITEYGLQIILDALDGMIAEDAADCVVSTAHKAKGREWSEVRMSNDFQEPMETRGDADGERRLLYVATTRARDVLDARMCDPVVSRLAGVPG